MNQTFMESRTPLRFNEFPPRIIVSIKPELDIFLYQTNLAMNSQEHHEITRQIFDNIDFGFEQFNLMLSKLPIFRLLSSFATNKMKYTDIHGNFNAYSINLETATKTYGNSIYMTCNKVGMFDGQTTPYILETVKDDICLLYNSHMQTNQ